MDALLKNARALTLFPPSVADVDIRITGGLISETGHHLRPRRGETVLDLGGMLVMPGMVNVHTHLYSALSRGMPSPSSSPRNFVEILKKVWWKLDEALFDEAIYYSGLVGAIDAVRFGTTTLLDHHASPNCIRGSLDLLKDALSHVGIRAVLCYETTDRGGTKRRDQGLEENERFVTENPNNPHFRGTIGAHASFTLSNESLDLLGELASIYDCGVHIHVAEDLADVRDALKRNRLGLTRRLFDHGIIRRRSILAHGIHLEKTAFATIASSGAWLVHNPRSNMNNAVGSAPLRWFSPAKSALGTDGFPADMFEEMKFGYFRNAESPHRTEFSRLPQMLQNGQAIVSEFFGQRFGLIAKGSPADLIMLDYHAPTPMTKQNILGHLLFGISGGLVRHVLVAGEWVMRDRRILGIDEEEVARKAQAVAKKLWKKLNG